MTIEELNRASQKSDQLQKEKRSKAGVGQVLLAGAISALFMTKPIASILRRIDMSAGSVLMERFPQLIKFTGAVTENGIDQTILRKALGTVRQTAPELSTSVFLRSVAGKTDTSFASMMLAGLKSSNLPEESIQAIRSMQYGAMSMSAYAAYSLSSRLVGNKSDTEKSYLNYMFTRGLPMFAAGIAATTVFKNSELSGMLKELPFINRIRETAITVMERVTDLPNHITALMKTGSELSGMKLGARYFSEFNSVYSRNIADVRKSSLYDSAVALRELLGFAKKAHEYDMKRTMSFDDISEMANSVVNDLKERFGFVDSRMYEALGLEQASIKSLMDNGILDEDAVVSLTRFADKFKVDLSEIMAGEGITLRDGALKLVDTPRKAMIKAGVESTKHFRIPYIFFNPLSLLQPRLAKEYLERGVYSIMAGDNVIPTSSGPKKIYEFGIDFINEQMPGTFNKEAIEQMPEKFKRNIFGVFSINVAGNKPFLTIDVEKALDFTDKGLPENIMMLAGDGAKRAVIDVSEALGEGYALRKSSIGGSITRAINMQQGMNIPKKAKSQWQANDMPFSNINNIEDPFYIKMYKKVRSFLGGSEFGGLFGMNKLERAHKMALEGNQWGYDELASLFRIVSANDVPYDVIETLSHMPETHLANTIASKAINSNEDMIQSYVLYMSGRAGMLRSAGEKAIPLRALSPSQMEWHIYSELKSLFQSGKSPTSGWLEEVITESGSTRMDIIRKSTTFALLATRQAPLKAVEELAASGKYSAKLISDLTSVAKYAQAEQFAYTWTSIFKNKAIPLENIMTEDVINTMHARIKKSSTFFNSYLKLIGDKVMPENMASKNVYMFLKRSKAFGEIEGGSFKERLWKYMSQWFPNSGDKSATTLTGTMAFYVADRPVQLFEAIGLGRVDYDKPSWFTQMLSKVGIENKFSGANVIGSIEQMITKRILPVAAAISAIGYAGYKLKETTGVDIKQGVVEGSKLALEGAAITAENIGLTSFSRFMKESFPGALPTLGAAAGMYMSGPFGLLYGGGIGALAENIPNAKKLQLEFRGEKAVNIRQGRFWELGQNEFMGGKVVYSRPHLLHLATTGWQYTDALWGSEKEYWQYKSMLPTPENTFGLNKLFDPYHFEERNQYMRPYPISGQSDIADVPVVGNLLQPLSYLLKPPKSYGDEMPYSITPANQAISSIEGMSYEKLYDATKKSPGFVELSRMEQGREYRSYYLQYPQIKYNPILETSIKGQLEGAAKDLSDYFGMVGFMAHTLAGDDNTKEGIAHPKIAHSGLAYSTERLYYQMQLGGILGQSELLRRVITRTQPTYTMDYINPLENRYFKENFNWLPKDYMIDFYHGDVYRSIGPYGEVRAPGPGYEATHKLYDNYGQLDRFLIMSNIAPYAIDTTIAERRITKEIEKYSPEERYQIQQAIDNAALQKERYTFEEGAFSKELIAKEIKLGEYLGKGEFVLANEAGQQTDIKAKLAGVDLDVDSVARRIYESERNVTIEMAYSMASDQVRLLETNLSNLSGSTISAQVAADENERYVFNSTSDITMPMIIEGLNKGMAEEYAGTRDVSGHWMNLRAVYGDSAGRAVWEKIAHLNTFINNKFFGQRSALETYQRDVVYGKSRKMWEHPIEDFLKPMFFNMANENPLAAFGYGSYLGVLSGATPISKAISGVFGGLFGAGISAATPPNLMPRDTLERWETEAKYDAMQAMKEEQYGLRNTSMLGMKTADSVQRTSGKLPRIEREFFRSFVNAPESQREEILASTPVYMQDLLKHFWRLKETAIESQLSGSALSPEATTIDWSNYEQYSSSLVEENPNWPGYDRYIDLNKLKTFEVFNRFNDYSKFEIYGNDIRSAMNNLLDTDQIYGNSYQLLSNTVNTYYAMKSIGQMNGAGIMGFSVAPQYNGANITFVKR